MSIRDKFIEIEAQLNERHYERGEVIRGLLCALLGRQHIVLLGPPGAGKSMLARDVTSRIGGRFFERLMTRMSTPEELFGPVSLKALEQDSYRRVTRGKLPEAEIAFVDEVFKGSSSILNTLLSVMNERIFHNDDLPVKVPLITMVGASNELPEDRDELGAVWDRFLFRYVVDWIHDPATFANMLAGGTSAGGTTITLTELEAAQAEVDAVDIAGVIPMVVSIRSRIREIGVAASDRRWHEAMSAVRANAWLNGHSAATEGDLTILAHVLWDEPGQRAQVKKAILQMVSPYDSAADEVLDDALDVYREAMAAPEEEQTQAGLQAKKALTTLARKLEAIIEEANNAGKPSQAALDARQKILAWDREILEKCLKVSI